MPQRDTSAVEVALNGLHAVIIDSQHAVANLGERLGPVSKGRAPDTTKGGTLGGGNCPALCKVEERISDATNLIRMLHQELVTLRESLCI